MLEHLLAIAKAETFHLNNKMASPNTPVQYTHPWVYTKILYKDNIFDI